MKIGSEIQLVPAEQRQFSSPQNLDNEGKVEGALLNLSVQRSVLSRRSAFLFLDLRFAGYRLLNAPGEEPVKIELVGFSRIRPDILMKLRSFVSLLERTSSLFQLAAYCLARLLYRNGSDLPVGS